MLFQNGQVNAISAMIAKQYTIRKNSLKNQKFIWVMLE